MVDIKAIRKMLGMTQREFAKAIGVDQSVVFRYEHGQTKPSKKRLERIDYILSCAGIDIPVEGVLDNSVPELPMSYQNDFVRRLIIQGTGGTCEFCSHKAPFLDKDERPYLCLHTFDKNIRDIDIVKKSVVLCPNCYARINVLANEDEIAALKETALKHNF